MLVMAEVEVGGRVASLRQRVQTVLEAMMLGKRKSHAGC